MKFKTIAMTGAISLAGLGLIGAGAHAAFTTTTSSSQQITTALLTGNVVLTSPCASSGNGSANITMAPVGPVGSDFATAACLITVNNNSLVPITYITIALTDSFGGSSGTADTALQN